MCVESRSRVRRVEARFRATSSRVEEVEERSFFLRADPRRRRDRSREDSAIGTRNRLVSSREGRRRCDSSLAWRRPPSASRSRDVDFRRLRRRLQIDALLSRPASTHGSTNEREGGIKEAPRRHRRRSDGFRRRETREANGVFVARRRIARVGIRKRPRIPRGNRIDEGRGTCEHVERFSKIASTDRLARSKIRCEGPTVALDP